jgi:hypothetical protein
MADDIVQRMIIEGAPEAGQAFKSFGREGIRAHRARIAGLLQRRAKPIFQTLGNVLAQTNPSSSSRCRRASDTGLCR